VEKFRTVRAIPVETKLVLLKTLPVVTLSKIRMDFWVEQFKTDRKTVMIIQQNKV
jgi:hypothetical protein